MPALGTVNPAMTLNKVDFPHPLGPIRETKSLLANEMSTLSMAGTARPLSGLVSDLQVRNLELCRHYEPICSSSDRDSTRFRTGKREEVFGAHDVLRYARESSLPVAKGSMALAVIIACADRTRRHKNNDGDAA
jgi:hypothetical protein